MEKISARVLRLLVLAMLVASLGCGRKGPPSPRRDLHGSRLPAGLEWILTGR